MNDKELLKRIKETVTVHEKPVLLRSGKTSNVYFDFPRFYADPKALAELARRLAKMLPKATTCVAGSGYGGLPLATAVSLASGIPLTTVRNEKKSHGAKNPVGGRIPTGKDRVAIVDDIFTTGSSILETAAGLRETKVKIAGAVVVIRREKAENFPIPLRHLFTLEDIL